MCSFTLGKIHGDLSTVSGFFSLLPPLSLLSWLSFVILSLSEGPSACGGPGQMDASTLTSNPKESELSEDNMKKRDNSTSYHLLH